MRRWTMFGLVIMLAFIVAANIAGPSAWAQEDQALAYQTVPTPTPKGQIQTPAPGVTPIPPTKEPKKPTDTPQPPPATVAPTATRLPATLTPRPVTATFMATTQPVTATSTATLQPLTATVIVTDAVKVTATLGSTAAIPPTATAAAVTAADTTPDASTGVANVAPVAPVDNAIPAPTSTSPTTDAASTNLWLIVLAVALVIFGGVLLFGRRRKKDAK